MNNNNYNFEPLPKLELDKNRKRVKQCPCGKSNNDGKFVPFVGYNDKGYCHSCGQTFLPDLPHNDSSDAFYQQPYMHIHHEPAIPKITSYIPFDIFKHSLTNYQNNNFVRFLISRFGTAITAAVVKRYYIGTSDHWPAATVFNQIDFKGRIRTGKIMLYNDATGKRVKEPDRIYWTHKQYKIDDFNLSQCLFGEHLLKDKSKAVAIVESEKTAVIASLYFPDYIWLATGGKQNLKHDFFTNLHNRKIMFFPDLLAYDTWTEKAKTLGITNYALSDLLERKATEEEKQQGLDIADFLLKSDYQRFRLKALIKQQFTVYYKEVWILDREKNYSLTNNNLEILCNELYHSFSLNVAPDEYYDAYKSLYTV
ncbi:MAG: DUF6371 domain-containing protein [Bacteroidales bacterium]